MAAMLFDNVFKEIDSNFLNSRTQDITELQNLVPSPTPRCSGLTITLQRAGPFFLLIMISP